MTSFNTFFVVFCAIVSIATTLSTGVTDCSAEEASALDCRAGTICKVVGSRARCAEHVGQGRPGQKDEVDVEDVKGEDDVKDEKTGKGDESEKSEKQCTRECPADFECKLNGDEEECWSENGKLCDKNLNCAKDLACSRIPGTPFGSTKMCLDLCKFMSPRLRCVMMNHQAISS